MARSTVSPHRSAISAFGLMPAEMTTMSHSSVLAVLEREAGHAVLAQDCGRVFLQVHLDAQLSPCWSAGSRRRRIELLLHQVPAEMHDVHLAAVVQQPARRLEAEQAAADHDGSAGFSAPRDHAGQSSSVRNPNTPGLSCRPPFWRLPSAE